MDRATFNSLPVGTKVRVVSRDLSGHGYPIGEPALMGPSSGSNRVLTPVPGYRYSTSFTGTGCWIDPREIEKLLGSRNDRTAEERTVVTRLMAELDEHRRTLSSLEKYRNDLDEFATNVFTLIDTGAEGSTKTSLYRALKRCGLTEDMEYKKPAEIANDEE